MNNEAKEETPSTPTPETETTKDAGNKEPIVVPVQGDPGTVKLDNEAELAILISLDTRTGEVAVYNVLNCPLSAYSRMLIREALRLYDMKSFSGLTVATLERRMAALASEKKPSILNPFKKP